MQYVYLVVTVQLTEYTYWSLTVKLKGELSYLTTTTFRGWQLRLELLLAEIVLCQLAYKGCESIGDEGDYTRSVRGNSLAP